MKCSALLTLSTAACLSIVSCDSLNQPLAGGDSSNPLDAPGGVITPASEDPFGTVFTPGTFLQTVSPSTSFFNTYPEDDDQPSRILPDYTDVKVISAKGSYVKIEVVDTGEVGYVPSIMLGEKRGPEEIPVSGSPTDLPDGLAPEPEIPGLELPTGDGNPAAPAPQPGTAPEPTNKGLEPPE